MARFTSTPVYYCSMCNDGFGTKSALQQHQVDHEESKKDWKCDVCKWSFSDELALENHQIQSEHVPKAEFMCDNPACQSPGPYLTIAALNKHQKFPSPCSDAFKPRTSRHHEETSGFNGPNLDLRLPNYGPPVPSTLGEDLVTVHSVRASPVPHTAASNDDIFCDVCQKSFPSMARYNNHWLACGPPRTSQKQLFASRHDTAEATKDPTTSRAPNISSVPLTALSGNGNGFANTSHSPPALSQARKDQAPKQGKPKVPLYQPRKSFTEASQSLRLASAALAHSRPQSTTVATTSDNNSADGAFKCIMQGCGRIFRSEAGLKVHQADVHGVGGQSLDLKGSDSWMLPQRIREQLKQQGLLRGSRPPPASKSSTRRTRNKGSAQKLSSAQPSRSSGSSARGLTPSTGRIPTGGGSTGTNIGGPEEIAQANEICSKIMRLNLQSDVLIQHDGKITCSGIDWTRIGVSRQSGLAGDFNKLCHLRPIHQAKEYLPPPNAFKNDYQSQYAISEFKHSAAPSPKNQALAIVAISCAKILLTNGRQEAVKVAAVDIATGRVLMNHLVCTDPDASVQEWRTTTTGMIGFQDMEAARQDGYKVFKGWQAVRTALWKFIDQNTILVGHNLRADLDSLRMIHGRAVDVAKLVEKAANGPLSKGQLDLDVLCRDLPQVHLFSDHTFGRDCLQNAFAAREIALWRIKNNDQCIRWAKQKSLDYQRLG